MKRRTFIQNTALAGGLTMIDPAHLMAANRYNAKDFPIVRVPKGQRNFESHAIEKAIKEFSKNAKKKEERGRYWYNTDLVTAHLGSIKAKHILLVSDSCYAGFYGKKRGTENIEADLERDLEDPAYFIKMLGRIARVYLTSGDDGPVHDGMGGKHSIFAKHFIKVLKQNKTTIDSYEVSHKVRKGVMGTVSQNPQYNYINE